MPRILEPQHVTVLTRSGVRYLGTTVLPHDRVERTVAKDLHLVEDDVVIVGNHPPMRVGTMPAQ